MDNQMQIYPYGEERPAQAAEDFRAAHIKLCLVAICGPVKTKCIVSLWGAFRFRFSVEKCYMPCLIPTHRTPYGLWNFLNK